MLFKVRFINKPDCPSKEVAHYNDNTTVVTLKGTIYQRDLPYIPEKIWQDLVKRNIDMRWDKLTFYVQGKAKKHPNDKFNPVIGERIAESRAKIKLYKTIGNLAYDVYCWYMKTATGFFNFVNSFIEDNNLWGTYVKYNMLLAEERTHLKKLLDEV
jgi:hypothetical protein